MYHLSNNFIRSQDYHVVLVGCGGTGGFAAEGLCRILPAKVQLILVDHDRVEERNLRRQNFSPDDIGTSKSEALANRLARRYRRAIAYSTYPAAMMDLAHSGIVIGCVDNGLARHDIADKIPARPFAWWIDAGNGDNFGQVLIGNVKEAAFCPEDEKCLGLPLPTMQRPELLNQPPEEPGCADIQEQGPTINQVMAVLVVEVVRRLIEGSCPWMQLLVDMHTGSLIPVMATPEAAAKIVGKRKVITLKKTKDGYERR